MSEYKKKGFSLLEVMVVIAIITLVVSVVLAGLQDARDDAQATSVRQHLREIVTSLELYKISNGAYPENSASADENYGDDLSDIVSTYLSQYVSYQSPSERITDTIYYKLNSDKYSCDKDSSIDEEPYIILFASSNPELKMAHVYIKDDGELNPYYYCVSLITG